MIYLHPSVEVHKTAIIEDGCFIWNQSQIRENVHIGRDCHIGKNVYIDAGVIIGNSVKIQNNSSIYSGCTIEDNVFIGPHVILTNDKYPRAVNSDLSLKKQSDWTNGRISIRKGASIGAGSIILPDLIIGKYSLIGAGTIVTKNVPDFGLIYGTPAKHKGFVCICGNKIHKGERCQKCFVSLDLQGHIKIFNVT
jgi:UDP-2-acetamido-3-amino-2,3-dideoxy-glucuronate N-acetyltransferase